MSQKPPFRLVEAYCSHDTIEALEHLLHGARRGAVIGLAFCAMYKQRTFSTDVTGEARRNPVFARGMVASLDDELSARSRHDQ